MTKHTIRTATSSDAAAIDAVYRAAFETDLEARLVALLSERGKATISVVAEVDGQIAGHILFSPATLESGPAVPAGQDSQAEVRRQRSSAGDQRTTLTGLGLAPVAVLPAIQNQGLGSALIRAGLDECRRLNVAWVVVLGHETYYPRFGFAPASRWNLTGDYGSHDAFQFLPLTADAAAITGGHIRYAPEFSEVLRPIS
jgi:putative acetyltransferase